MEEVVGSIPTGSTNPPDTPWPQAAPTAIPRPICVERYRRPTAVTSPKRKPTAHRVHTSMARVSQGRWIIEDNRHWPRVDDSWQIDKARQRHEVALKRALGSRSPARRRPILKAMQI
jgi:hypothetical protein